MYEDVEKVLKSLGFQDGKIKNIQASWHNYIINDYKFALITTNRRRDHPEIPEEHREDWDRDSEKIIRNINDYDSKYIESVFAKYTESEKIKDILDDLFYYEKNFQHRDVEKWRNRSQWFQGK